MVKRGGNKEVICKGVVFQTFKIIHGHTQFVSAPGQLYKVPTYIDEPLKITLKTPFQRWGGTYELTIRFKGEVVMIAKWDPFVVPFIQAGEWINLFLPNCYPRVWCSSK